MNDGVERDESESLAKLAEALAKAQGMMESATKDSANPFFKSRYADLAANWDACRGPLSANGLAVIQRVSSVAEGVMITTMLIHSSGEWVRDRCVWPCDVPRALKQGEKPGTEPEMVRTPQSMGSAITYGRRYALAALVGIAADDDDGNAASPRPSAPATQPARSGVAAVKDALRSRVVDVGAGETEEQAEARMKTPWGRILELGKKHGKSEDELRRLAKDATAKRTPAELNDDDVARVEASLVALSKVPASGAPAGG